MLKSDGELEQDSGYTLDVIRTKAAEILTSLAAEPQQNKNQLTNSNKGKKTKKGKSDKPTPRLFNILSDAYEQTADSLMRSALAYLLKNDCQLRSLEEDPEEFLRRRRKKEIEIERLKKQQKSQIPKGRDLTGEKWLEVLEVATRTVPQNEDEAKTWQAGLLRKSINMPYSVNYGSSTDLTWLKNDKGRILVKFNGLGKHLFEVYCDRRQLHWFQRFLEDWQIDRNNKNKYPTGLFAFCSARLLWLEGKEKKGTPWKVHRLALHCSIDTRAWTAEGTELIASEKIIAAEQTIKSMEQKDDLNEKQLKMLQRKRSERERLNTSFPSRPSKPIYQGQSHILVGVSLSLKKPATVAVVDASNNKVLVYRSVKQLLGDNYKLLDRQRQQQQRLSHERHKAQKQNAPNSFGESELGMYVDRLLAAAIVAIAKTYSAGSIVLPELRNIREQVSSEIQALAEKKISGYKQGQQKYAKPCHISIHRWSYGRLIECIQSFAAKAGIAVEIGQQPRGSPHEKARDLALFAYHYRQAQAT